MWAKNLTDTILKPFPAPVFNLVTSQATDYSITNYSLPEIVTAHFLNYSQVTQVCRPAIALKATGLITKVAA